MIPGINVATENGFWQDAEAHVLYVTTYCYATWWAHVSVGYLSTARYRDGNADYITDAAIKVDLETPGPSQHTRRGVRRRPEPMLLSGILTVLTVDGDENIVALPVETCELSDAQLGEEISRLSHEELARRYRRRLCVIAGTEAFFSQGSD